MNDADDPGTDDSSIRTARTAGRRRPAGPARPTRSRSRPPALRIPPSPPDERQSHTLSIVTPSLAGPSAPPSTHRRLDRPLRTSLRPPPFTRRPLRPQAYRGPAGEQQFNTEWIDDIEKNDSCFQMDEVRYGGAVRRRITKLRALGI